MIIDVSEQSKFFKQKGCAATDNMFRMAFSCAEIHTSHSDHSKTCTWVMSDCNRFNLRNDPSCGQQHAVLVILEKQGSVDQPRKGVARSMSSSFVLISQRTNRAGFPFVISMTTAVLFFTEPGNLAAVGNRADCRALVARQTSPVDRPRQRHHADPERVRVPRC